ncbi:amino acid adenylation domain-containing protein, partial [Paraburkholderia sp. Ac-20340]|uniref:non-ribosomal peptide synthetase n=1 Tax=Paraburkholderia sp. Ac-20340 TaxID=2703888 RepID=UPI00198197BE
TSRGKIDRRALPAPAATEADTAHTPLIEPRTPLEAQLLAIWRAVLPAQSLGVTTDFFAAGGDSILSLRVVSAARDAGLALSPRLVFQHPSIEQLARVTTTLTPQASQQAEQQPAANRELDTTIAAALTRAGIDLQTLADVYATTPLQRGLLSLGLRADVDPYHLQRVFELRGPFDTAAFHAAWRQVSARHGALRTDFFADGLDVPVQLVRREASIDFDTLDWRALGDDEARDALAAQWRAAQAGGFDFARASHQRVLLIERGEHCRWFVWRFHHAQLDGWSIGIVLRDLLQAYGALREARPLALQTAPAFADYVRWLDTRHDEAETLAPWRETLAAWTPTPLPLARPLAHTTRIEANSRALEHTLQLSSDESAQLERFARTCGVTLNTLIQGAWIWLLSRHANQRDIALGVTVSGRSDGWAGADETAGLFINTLPLAVTLPPSMTVRAWLADLQTRNLSLQEHAQTPLATLQRAFAGQAGTPLFESIFVFENYPLDAALRAPLAQGLAIRRVATGVDGHAHDGRNHFPLSLIAVPGEALTLTLAAQPTHYDDAAVQQLATQLRGALDAFVADPARAMGAIGAVGAIGFDQPQTAAPKHAETSLLARVAHHAATQPRAVALLDETGPLDWGTLWSDAGALAARLTAFGIGAEDTVAVALPRSHALVVAMLAIWRAGGVYAPLDPSMPAARLAWQLRDADARCLIAADDPVWRAQDIALLKPATAHASAEPHAIDTHIALPAQRAAYLIYTSGSTGTPKGVTIPHGALAAYVAALLERLPTGINSAAYLSTPAADLGHSTLMAALWSGWTLHLIDDARAFDADRYAQWCSEHPVDLLKISPSHLEGLLHAADARAVLPRRALLLGGEASGATLLDRLAALRPECALLGHYGPTESTVGVLTSERDASGALPLGRPLRHAHAYLLDADGTPALPGATGEIHLGGVALARGYRGRPGLTAERFVPDPRVPGARVYRTGDRARVREDGQFEFLGRVDEQLKIRGHRVEPAEVAAHLRALPGVRDAAVIGQKDAQQRLRLIGYVTGDDLDVHALHDALAQRVPAALVPSALHRLDVLPLTRNGKIDRAALAALNLSNTADLADAASHAKAAEAAAPQTPTQHALLAIWRSVLRAPELGIDDNFFMAGGDSINAFQVVAQARRQALVFSSRELFAQPTVRELCATLDAAAGEANSQVRSAVASLDAAALGALGLDPARVQDAYPATPMQQGLLFHSLAHGDRTPGDGGMYVTQRRLKLAGALDRARLIAAWQHAVARHDILRTRFEWHGDTLLQVVDKTVDLPFATHEARTESRAEYEARLIDWMRADLARGFDAARAPLMRLDLFAAPDGGHDLVWTTHHALLDGWSAAQLLAETWTNYRSPENAVTHEASAPYRAYVDWLDAQPDAADWWREAAAHCDDPATLTACLNPPAVPQEGAFRMEAPLGAARERALRDAAAAFGVTLNTLMQGAWAVLLARLGNRDSAAFGCTVSGRPETLDGAAQMLGLFINSLPVWTPVQPDAEIGAWLRTLQTCAAAMRHYEHTPLAQLQRWVGRSGDALFDTLFVFENYPLEATLEALDDAGHAGDALRVNGVESAGRTHYPLTLMVVPQPTLRLEWEWDGLRLDREHVGRLAQAYEALLDQIASGAGASLRSLALPVVTREAVPLDAYAFEPVAERVARRLVAQPDRVALRGEHAAHNGVQLQQWANSIAASVRNADMKRDACVAVCVERSPALIASMLGIWQAGAAYLPVDPAYPDERIAAMLDDARVTCVIADATTASRFEALNVVRADLAFGQSCEASFAPVHPDQLAYVIYTSGSTGKPKGVGVTHGALDRLVASIARKPGLPADASWLSESAPVFDISLLEYCLPLVAGIPLEIVSAQTARDGFGLAKRLEESGANVFQATPSGWRMLIEAGWRDDFEAAQHPPLLGISGGEALHPDLAAALIARNVTLWNIYGPTETTIYSAGAQVHADKPITHGDPLPDTVLRVIDRQGAAVPDGGLGELCIGGENLARGYLGRPGLTAERFVPDPDGAPGARIYRTGDLCRLRADGRPEPFGRLDQQIKLRGFRIEPGEIEAALCACEGVAHAAVVLRGEGARQRLAAYVSGTAQPADLRAQLARTLPAHMVPSAIVALATLPLTPSGKLDRRALPEPAWDDDSAQAIAPRNEREQTLLDIWQSVLGHAVHSVCMNFFEAGGDSISGVRVAARINETFGRSVPLADLFAHATIRSLADLLETQDKNPQQTDADALSQLLADFE